MINPIVPIINVPIPETFTIALNSVPEGFLVDFNTLEHSFIKPFVFLIISILCYFCVDFWFINLFYHN